MKVEIYKRDQEILESFLERAWSIQNSRYFKFKKRNLSFKVEKNATISIQIPEEDDIYAIASLVRPFTLNDQEIYIYRAWKILSGIEKQSEEKQFLSFIENYKKNYKKTLEKFFMQIKINNKNYSPEELLDLFLYGQYVKNDLDKNTVLKEMGYFKEIFKFQFIDVLDSLIQLILKTANIYELMKKEYIFTQLNSGIKCK